MVHRLLSWTAFQKAGRIAVYFAANGEVDLDRLALHAWDMSKRVYLPVLHPFAGNKLWFSEWRPTDRLRPNRFSIPEPIPRWRKPLPPNRLDMVCVPLVAFDSECGRIGMGGGYYDRTFAYRHRTGAMRRPLLVGIAHELQKVDGLSRAPWDIGLDAVVTECRIQLCKGDDDVRLLTQGTAM